MPWVIVSDEPENVSDTDKDASIWRWEIERDGEQSYIDVTLTLPSMAGTNPLADVREARETKGRNAVEQFLDDDAPPRQVLVSSNGIST